MPGFLLADVFDNAEVVRDFDGPLLLLHGRHDELIPPAEAEEMRRLAADGQLRFYECGHFCWYPDDLPLHGDIRAFLEKSGVLRANGGGA
jgi:pimeloyl-ACP methyl ester carboxylesterase